MGVGFSPTWLRQVSPLVHKTTLTTDTACYAEIASCRLVFCDLAV